MSAKRKCVVGREREVGDTYPFVGVFSLPSLYKTYE